MVAETLLAAAAAAILMMIAIDTMILVINSLRSGHIGHEVGLAMQRAATEIFGTTGSSTGETATGTETTAGLRGAMTNSGVATTLILVAPQSQHVRLTPIEEAL
jgi:hypothetical protein